MTFDIWLVFALAYLTITFSPGPNVLIVIAHAVKFGYGKIFTTILANLTCQLAIVIAVALGVGALMSVDSFAFKVIKLVGAGYLVYLGTGILYRLVRNRAADQINVSNNTLAYKSAFNRFRQAFFVSAGNPKTVVFLAAFLPQFIDQQQSIFGQFLIMYVTIAVIVLTVHAVYAWIAVTLNHRVTSRRLRNGTSAVTGLLFIFLGGALLKS